MKLIIGVDEAGRGPLAGPVTVGVFLAEEKLKNRLIEVLGGKIKDSKKLSEKLREKIFETLKGMKISGEINFEVAHSSAKVIDKIGISKAIKNAVEKSFRKITPPSLRSAYPYIKGRQNQNTNTIVRLDGLLKAPEKFKNQKTIVGGDAKDAFIACASIVAKVSRDRLMRRLVKKYPEYNFDVHKGYGTNLHRKLLQKHGLSDIHRKSFCKKLT